MTEADFLAAVIDRPADDTPRLAFADYLEDRGLVARADYIRSSIAFAGDGSPPGHEARRLDALLAVHAVEWAGPAALDKKVRLLWSRGFVRELRLAMVRYGGVRCPHGSYGLHMPPNCDECHGSGYIKGYGVDLFRRHPIACVRITDRLPQAEGGAWLWLPAEHYELEGDEEYSHLIPEAIFRRLFAGSAEDAAPDAYRGDDADAMMDALNRACLGFARDAANRGNHRVWPIHIRL